MVVLRRTVGLNDLDTLSVITAGDFGKQLDSNWVWGLSKLKVNSNEIYLHGVAA